jgi:hypothetical protein
MIRLQLKQGKKMEILLITFVFGVFAVVGQLGDVFNNDAA